jgi:hypothetical protein
MRERRQDVVPPLLDLIVEVIENELLAASTDGVTHEGANIPLTLSATRTKQFRGTQVPTRANARKGPRTRKCAGPQS